MFPSPPPRGRYPIDALPGNRQPLYRQREHPHRNPVPVPCHGHPVQSPRTARPHLAGAAGWRGCFHEYRETQETGAADLPSPGHGDSSSIHCQERIQCHSDRPPSLVGRRSAGVFRKILLKNLGSVPDTVSSRRFPLTAQPSHARASSHQNLHFHPAHPN